jgi:hypothetical protein
VWAVRRGWSASSGVCCARRGRDVSFGEGHFVYRPVLADITP